MVKKLVDMVETPYWQYFSGEKVFQTQKPFDPTEFKHFRNRIGKEGAEKTIESIDTTIWERSSRGRGID